MTTSLIIFPIVIFARFEIACISFAICRNFARLKFEKDRHVTNGIEWAYHSLHLCSYHSLIQDSNSPIENKNGMIKQ